MKRIILVVAIAVIGFIIYMANTLEFGNSWI